MLANADAKLKAIRAEIEKCRLLAPVDGMVHYSSNFIQQGARVRERQPIVSIVPLSTEADNVRKNVLVIPVGAVRKNDGRISCFVETLQGIERRTIRLGPSGASFVEVIDGLKEGERVLLGPVSLDNPRGRRPTGNPRR